MIGHWLDLTDTNRSKEIGIWRVRCFLSSANESTLYSLFTCIHAHLPTAKKMHGGIAWTETFYWQGAFHSACLLNIFHHNFGCTFQYAFHANSIQSELDQNRRLHNTHVCKVALIFKLKIKYIPPQMDILIYLHCIFEMYMRGMRIHRKKTRDSRQKFRLLMEDYIILHKDVFRRTSKSLETIFLLHCCAHHNDSGSPCTWKLEVVGRPKSTMERSCRHKKPKQNTNKKTPNKHKPANTKPTRPLQNLSGSHFIFSSK